MQETTTTRSARETQELASSVAARLRDTHLSRAAVVTLRGDLGAGKTTFTQGLLRALGVAEPVTSPTFVLVQRYPVSTPPFTNAYHVDAYRLTKAADLDALELGEPLKDPSNVIVIEWPEVGADAFTPTVDLAFSHGPDPEVRDVTATWHA
jgi:tRNA threonylcarbamoyladenosine biosynthesis protein TsaE